VTLPHIRSVEEAKTAIGFFQEAKANVWSPGNPTGTIIAMLMVEDPGAVAVAGQIADLEGVSVLACGIGSLTQALGGDRAAGEAGTQKVLTETRRTKLPNMLTASPQDVQQRVKEGFLGLLGQGPAGDEMIKLGRQAAGR
jgi:2-keto-3-deoxy-L-rhamnonate aldolase RhmA